MENKNTVPSNFFEFVREMTRDVGLWNPYKNTNLDMMVTKLRHTAFILNENVLIPIPDYDKAALEICNTFYSYEPKQRKALIEALKRLPKQNNFYN